MDRAAEAAQNAVDSDPACDGDSLAALRDLKETFARAAVSVKLRARQRAAGKAQRLGETEYQTKQRLWQECLDASTDEQQSEWA